VVDSLKFWLQAGLLADLIDCDAIELIVPFDGDCLLAVCVYRVFTAFPQQVEAVFFQVAKTSRRLTDMLDLNRKLFD